MTDVGETVGGADEAAAQQAGPEADRISEKGVSFIASFEGFRSRLYNDPLGHCTIGYGHLVHRGRCNGSEPDRFKRGITQEEGRQLLRQDVKRYAAAVSSGVRVPLNQHQFDALVSFTYNVGAGAFHGSTLRQRLNRRDYASVPGELMRWTSGGLPGLVKRRRAEGVLFRDGRYSMTHDEDQVGGGLTDEEVGAPEQRREGGPKEESAEPPGPGEERPNEPDHHEPVGPDPQDVGERVEEPDTPVPDDEDDQTEADRLVRGMQVAVDLGLVITSTTGGKHSPNSYHYSRPYRTVVVRGRRYQLGRAFDTAKAGNPDRLYRRFFHDVEYMRPTELFYDPVGYYWKNGRKVNGAIGGHRDHVHMAI